MGWMRKPMENYKGRHCGCVPGTHAALVEMIRKHVRPTGGVLDIGAHAGALLMRLQDAGFSDLYGTDLDPTRFNCPGAEFKRLELNADFAAEFDRKFNLITSTDVVEHLDSPRHFLLQARELLTDGGYLGVSLPNVAFWEGRCKFALKGELWGFGARNYLEQRHISPLTFEMMDMLMREVGFEIAEATSAGSFATIPRAILTFPIWALIRLLGGSHALGESAIFLARKTAPNMELKSPIHYRDRWRGVPDRIGLE